MIKTSRFLFSTVFLCVSLASSFSTLLHAESDPTIISLVQQFQLRESNIPSRDMPGWRKLKKIVLWGDQNQLETFQKSFPDLDFFASKDIGEISKQLKTADGFIGRCSPALFNQSLNIHWFQSLSVGVEACVNAKAMTESDIILTNSQRLSAPGIADHAIAMMFSLVRRLDQYAQSQTHSEWNRRLEPGNDKIWEIEGRTMLVVGLGGIGTQTAKRAHALGMKVIATRNSSKQGPDFVSYVGLSDELFSLAEQADIVVNTVPLTNKTIGLFNRKFFKKMKPNAYFINVARGKSVVTDDLLAALNAGELAGAGLDVMDPEPLPADHALWKQPRVLITPHIAHRSEKVRQRILQLSKENLRRYINGEKLLSVVNIQRGY